MSQLYMDHFDEEILIDMIKISEEYLKWFSYIDKHVEFFEKEEGHLYEKIGEGYIEGDD